MTKAEFLDQLAGDERIGSKKAAGEPSTPCSTTITDVLSSGGEVNFTGFGKFHVAERGPRQGVNPRTGERITIPGGKVPRFSAGSALKSEGQGLSSSRSRSPIGWRRSSPSAAARSASASIPTRRALGGRRRRRRRRCRCMPPPRAIAAHCRR